MTNQKQIVLTTKMTTENKETEREIVPQKTGTKDNVVFIGGKPFMNYVTGVVMQFNTYNAPEVTVKSRGKFISKAVDVAEVSRRKFLVDQKISVKEIKIDSEEFENKEGRTVNVSIMDIVLKRG
jgi:archaea-specific DNA-binding protein